MHRNIIAIALLLGGALTMGLLLLLPHVVQSAPPAAAPQAPSAPSAGVAYYRTQTVTLHSPASADIYTTAFSTTFQILMTSYPLGNNWLRLPTDAVTHTASCDCEDPGSNCGVVWETNQVTFQSGDGCSHATIYLEYDTQSKARREAGSRIVTLAYPVGPDTAEIALTNTILFSRTMGPAWKPGSPVVPSSYVYNSADRTLTWVFTSTPRRVYTATLVEPLLGSDLVIERLEMSNRQPAVGELVHYTVTVRNVGNYTTGQAVMTELFVRSFSYGPPTAVDDHRGGWNPQTDALFKWEGTDPPSHWWAGLDPGAAITGTLALTWPTGCSSLSASQYPEERASRSGGSTPVCGVWAKVDSTCLEMVYDWWGYNAEGFGCGSITCEEGGEITCEEELNNIEAIFHRINLPLVMRNSGSGGDGD